MKGCQPCAATLVHSRTSPPHCGAQALSATNASSPSCCVCAVPAPVPTSCRAHVLVLLPVLLLCAGRPLGLVSRSDIFKPLGDYTKVMEEELAMLAGKGSWQIKVRSGNRRRRRRGACVCVEAGAGAGLAPP